MTPRSKMLLVVAVLATMLFGLAWQASAQDPASPEQVPSVSPGGKVGIAKAKAAGITVDPAMEAMMARAPAGSCPNDPTQPKCGKVTAVVYAPEVFGGADAAHRADVPPSPKAASASKGSRKVKRLRARAAYLSNQCMIKVTDQSPYKAAGYAQGDGKQYCSPAVTIHYFYQYLLKWYNGRYYQMKIVETAVKPGGTWAYASARYYCTSTVNRYWQARAEGYASLKGIIYGGVYANYKYLNCG